MKSFKIFAGVMAIIFALALNLNYAYNNYGIADNDQHNAVLAQSNSSDGGNSSGGDSSGGDSSGGGSTTTPDFSKGCRTVTTTILVEDPPKPDVITTVYRCDSGTASQCNKGSVTTINGNNQAGSAKTDYTCK